MKNNKCLGIDIGTQQIAFWIYNGGKSFGFSKSLKKIKSHKNRRNKIREYLKEFNPDYIVLERVRLFHHKFININAIKRLMGVTYLIIDFFDCPVYSVDVRSWKKNILGSAKVEKKESIKYVKEKYNLEVDNDLADAICIMEMGLKIKELPEKFKLEE